MNEEKYPKIKNFQNVNIHWDTYILNIISLYGIVVLIINNNTENENYSHVNVNLYAQIISFKMPIFIAIYRFFSYMDIVVLIVINNIENEILLLRIVQ